MDYLGGDAALKHHKQMAKLRQASRLSPTRMSPTSRPVRIHVPTHSVRCRDSVVVVFQCICSTLRCMYRTMKSKQNSSLFGIVI